jgi:hypothetical protein
MDQEAKKISIVAFMTAPRYENTWARNYIEIALKQAGIPLAVSGGVFYGQCMQTMMERAVDDGVDVGLTIDFDSVFTKAHIDTLLSRLCFDEDIDAVCAMQCRRGGKTPLASCGQERKLTTDGRPIKVTTAHFGLTAIDMKKLRDVPKPWFHSQPNKDGSWSGDKTDDDIWFWRQWEKAGNSIYMDPNCQIGHLEEVVTHFVECDGEYQAVHTYPSDWAKANVG